MNPEGRAEIQARAERAQAARSDIARCEFHRVTPSRHSHRQVAASQRDVPALLDALDDAECEIERQRGDLVIERRRAEAAEAALDRVRALCMSTDGDWINSDFIGNTVGDIRRALDGTS